MAIWPQLAVYKRRNRGDSDMDSKTKAALHGGQCQSTKLIQTQHNTLIDLVKRQPFGSMPCLLSSARASSLNQFPRLTPSRSAASLSCWRRSGFILIWNVGDHPSPFGDLSRLMLDMYVRNLLACYPLGTYVNTYISNKTTPRSAGTHAGRLTTNAK